MDVENSGKYGILWSRQILFGRLYIAKSICLYPCQNDIPFSRHIHIDAIQIFVRLYYLWLSLYQKGVECSNVEMDHYDCADEAADLLL